MTAKATCFIEPRLALAEAFGATLPLRAMWPLLGLRLPTVHEYIIRKGGGKAVSR